MIYSKYILYTGPGQRAGEGLTGLGKGLVDRLGNFVAPVQITAQPQTNPIEKLR